MSNTFPMVVLIVLTLAFTGTGAFLVYRSLRFIRHGNPVRFRVVDFMIIEGGEAEQYPALYEVLEGPRRGDIVRTNILERKVTTNTVLTTERTSAHYEHLRAKIGKERRGWVHDTDDIGATLMDFTGSLLIAGFVLIAGLICAVVAGVALFG